MKLRKTRALMFKKVVQKQMARHYSSLTRPVLSALHHQRPSPAVGHRCLSSSSNSNNSSNRNEEGSNNNANEQDRLFPVYMHHVSKVVLQHLQDSRAGWLMEQGLHKGLQIRSNGTFVLNFPRDEEGKNNGGKIWTEYNTDTRQHWLSVYRPNNYSGRFLLRHNNTSNLKANNNHVASENQVRNTVDEMIRVLPPRIRTASIMKDDVK